ncbi:MAG TPA: multiubiquitin domain-containing protein [Candidatus Acidoferrum sp.]|nr:multiubiquitin domain-containing protein [Candidatus Acidoferrum sp.]
MENETAQKDREEKDQEKQKKFQIQIDRVHYTVTQNVLTGSELRRVPPTPIGPDRDLFEVVPGGTDKKIEDTEQVEIRDGERFFTAPAHINPGSKIRREH